MYKLSLDILFLLIYYNIYIYNFNIFYIMDIDEETIKVTEERLKILNNIIKTDEIIQRFSNIESLLVI